MTSTDAAPSGLALLRQEVPEHLIGKLPKVTCGDCRKKQCDKHRPSKCDVCGGWLGYHTHLDYVGHAETTAMLLEADPAWNWEPLSFGPDGLPAFDPDGGLWIKLTVCGVTRLGYGTADNANGFKSRGDLRKELIGDALRNAAMRFGWALNLWAKSDIHERAPQEEPEQPAPQVRYQHPTHGPRTDEWSAPAPDAEQQSAPAESPEAKKSLLTSVHIELSKRVGNKREDHLGALAAILGVQALETSNDLTVEQARGALKYLKGLPLPPEGWTREDADQLAADFVIKLGDATTDTERTGIAKLIADAVKVGKIMPHDRRALLDVYNGAPKRGGRAPQGDPSWSARGMAAMEQRADAMAGAGA